MKNILIPIDFSLESEKALTSGFEIAKSTGSSLHVVHIIEEREPSSLVIDGDLRRHQRKFNEYQAFIMQLISRKRKDLNDLIDKYADPTVKVEYSIKLGGFRQGMHDVLQDINADLIIMGSNGEESFTQLFTGNRTAQVIRWADVPVLALQDTIHVSQLEKLMILVDFRDYNQEAINSIQRFTKALNMRVLVAHIAEYGEAKDGSIQEKLEAFATDNGFEVESVHVLGYGEKIEKIEEFVEKWDVHLVASISQTSDLFTRLFFGSDTEKLANKVDANVLAISE